MFLVSETQHSNLERSGNVLLLVPIQADIDVGMPLYNRTASQVHLLTWAIAVWYAKHRIMVHPASDHEYT